MCSCFLTLKKMCHSKVGGDVLMFSYIKDKSYDCIKHFLHFLYMVIRYTSKYSITVVQF